MKLNLVFGSGVPLDGYLNVSPTAAGCVYAHFSDLDPVVEDAEASEILASDVADFVPASAFDDMLAHWARKLARGGTLTVRGLDLADVCRMVASRQLDLPRANLLIYGDQSVPSACRKSATSLPLMCGVLRSVGLTIAAKAFAGPFYTVTARRP
jgi:hypothetical protein